MSRNGYPKYRGQAVTAKESINCRDVACYVSTVVIIETT